MKRIALLLIALLLVMLTVIPGVFAASTDGESAVGTLDGEVNRTTEELKLDDGTATGVEWTQIELAGFYGSKIVNVAEFSLADPHLSLEVINSGATIVSSATTAAACKSYTRNNEGQTVLAAVNGDLWMTDVHSNRKVTKAVLKTSRGALIIDGEVWATQQIDMENYAATNGEKGGAAGDMAAFGVTDTNQPLVGSPDICVSICVNGAEIEADGINRLPCRDSVIVYNRCIGNTNFALDDSYEIEIEMDNGSAFMVGGDSLSGTVKAVYPEKSATRPAIGNENTIVLTARGSKISTLEENFKVGDKVGFSMTLTDRWGNTEQWQHVKEAIGGHIPVLLNGKTVTQSGDSSEYPTSLIGYRNDGTVMICNITSTMDKTYAGLKFSHALKFCRELGYNSVFYLDGGGSSTFVTLKEGTYTVRNKCSDGSARSVINSVGVVWNDTPVCKKQGSLGYIQIPLDMTQIPATHMDGALLAELVGSPNAVTMIYDENERALAVTTTTETYDPYTSLNFIELMPASAEQYPYLVFRVKHNYESDVQFKLYYAAGSVGGATEDCTRLMTVKAGDDWQYIIVDMTDAPEWNGNINSIRLDVFDQNVPADTTMYISDIVLCERLEDAQNVESGWLPEDCVKDYLVYKESYKPVVTEPSTETSAESSAEELTETVTEAAAKDSENVTEKTGGYKVAIVTVLILLLTAAVFLILKKKH